MKISLWTISAMMAATQASAMNTHKLSDKAMKALLSNSRRLEQGDNNNQGGGAMEVEDYLMDYSLKMVQCNQEETLSNGDNNYQQAGVVTFRLCPSNSCSDNKGCSSGYADFAVDLNTFVDAFMEDQKDNMAWDDAFDVENFAQCAQYEVEDGNDGQNNGNDGSYYVGPACSEDGTDVRLALFSDGYCSQLSNQKSFEDLSNGWALPFGDGGLVSSSCISCTDNDNGGLREMCQNLYESAPYKCETWDIQHYFWDDVTEVNRYGQDQTGCLQITRMDKTPQPFSEWGSLIFISLLVIVTIVGGAWYVVWWKNKKMTLEKIDDEADDDDDDMEYHQHDDDGTHAAEGIPSTTESSPGVDENAVPAERPAWTSV